MNRPRSGSAPRRQDAANKTASKDQKKPASTQKPKPALTGAGLLWLHLSGIESADSVLDLIRGRTETTDPPRLPSKSRRTNDQGADFQAPPTALAWRDRAEHLREQMLSRTRALADFPKTPLYPKIYGKLDRGDYTIEKVVLETFPGFTLSGNLYRPANRSGRPRRSCAHMAIGGWARQPRGPAALHPLGQARLRRVPLRYGRVQRQQTVQTRVLNDRFDAGD